MKEFTFLSADKVHRLHAVIWKPQGNAIGIVQLVHGMTEHIGRYDELGNYLAGLGFLVVGHDHLGHGYSVNSKDEYGYIAKKNPDIVLIQDIHKLRKIITKVYPDIPYFILGHSMGSYLVRRYIQKAGDGIRGAILLGAGEQKKQATVSGLLFIEVLALFRGWKHRSRLARKLTYMKPYKKFDLTGKNHANSWLSRNVEEVDKYYEDEKCNFIFTLNAYKALVRTAHIDNKKKNVKKIPRNIAILMLSGADDPVGDLGRGTTKVYEKMCRSGILEVSLKLYDGARHELLHENNTDEVLEDIGAWLGRYVNKKRRGRRV